MYQTMLVATDGSVTATKAVRMATDLAKAFGAVLHVANVYQDGGGISLPDTDTEYAAPMNRASVADTQTESAASYARSKGVSTESHVVRGDPAQQIVALAVKHDIDVIVVGNKGMRGAKRVLGSVPNSVAHHAPCDILIVNTT